jgi:N utilization substance protein A
MFDLKVINSVLDQLSEERGISKEKSLEAIEYSLATAYKKEYGKRDQIVRAHFDINTGETTFEQVKVVVDENSVRMIDPDAEDVDIVESAEDDEELKPRYNPERHMLIEEAQKVQKDAKVDDEIMFQLEAREDFGRIAAQTAKQMIIQKIREAEKEHLSEEFGKREGEIVTGTVQRIERGNIFIDLGRAVGILPSEEQIPGERYRQGERVRGYLYRVEESPRGVFLRISRSHPNFLYKLFETESPEVANSTVEIRAIAREPGSRSKVAVFSTDDHIDPVGSLVGQRGVRVATVMSELGGEKIDIVEWSDDPTHFLEEALSPAEVLEVEILDEKNQHARVSVSPDQQSLAIGKGGQNVRLAAKLTGWKIDIISEDVEEEADSSDEIEDSAEPVEPKEIAEKDVEEKEATKTEDVASEEIKETPENEVSPAEDENASEKEA